MKGLHLTHRVRPHAGCGSFGYTWLYHGGSGSHDSGHLGLAKTVLREIHHSAVDTQTVKSYDGEMAPWVKGLATKPEDLNLIPKTCVVGGANQTSQVGL